MEVSEDEIRRDVRLQPHSGEECLKSSSYFIRVERVVELILIELQPGPRDHLKTSPTEDVLRRLHRVCWKVLLRAEGNCNYEIFNTGRMYFRKGVIKMD